MDMYHIPGDTGHPFRLNKFLEYQHYAPAIDPIVNTRYAERHKLSPDDCILLAWYHSVVYCEVTAIWLIQNLDFYNMTPKSLKSFWGTYKDKMIFGSARRYAKSLDWFVPLISQFRKKTKGKPENWLENLCLGSSPQERYHQVSKEISGWKYTGRFSVDLFLEALISFNKAGLIPVSFEIPKYDWKNCSNLTSGLMNIMYLDQEADEFDKSGKVLVSEELLDKRVLQIQNLVKKRYPDQDTDIVSVMNKICSFRNLFKQRRYGGFHHDRELGNLIKYQKTMPESEAIWDELFEIRQECFPKNMLGELNGWSGIRPERKKLWIQEGKTGVEHTS